MGSPRSTQDDNGEAVPRRPQRGAPKLAIGIIPAARKELGRLRLDIRRIICRSVYENNRVDIKRVSSSGDLYRLRFSGDTRAAAKLVDNTFVILRIGKKSYVEQFYSKYFRSAICREVDGWVRLEDSGIDPFVEQQSLKSIANAVSTRLDERIDAVDQKANVLTSSVRELKDDVALLELCEQDQQSAFQELKQRVETFLQAIQDRRSPPVATDKPEDSNGSHLSWVMRMPRRLLEMAYRDHPARNGSHGNGASSRNKRIGGQPR